MFLIGFVDEHHVFASAGNLETPVQKYLVTHTRIITECTNFNFFFPLSLSNFGIKLFMLTEKSAVQFCVSMSNWW